MQFGCVSALGLCHNHHYIVVNARLIEQSRGGFELFEGSRKNGAPKGTILELFWLKFVSILPQAKIPTHEALIYRDL
jgi:hypothetical protein